MSALALLPATAMALGLVVDTKVVSEWAVN